MSEEKCITVTWRIKNFRFCWQEEEELSGPSLDIEGKKCRLVLFPKASRSKQTESIACYFYLDTKKKGRLEDGIYYELSALGGNGLPIATETFSSCIIQENGWSFPLNLEQAKVFLEKSDTYLPKDSLTIRYRIWPMTPENTNAERYFAETRIELEKVSILGIVKKGVFQIKGTAHYVEVISVSTGISPILISFRVTDGIPYAQIHLASYKMKFCKCELHFTDVNQKEIFYGQDEFLYLFSPHKREEWDFPLKATNAYGNSENYPELENLTLQCEFTYSTGIVLEKIQKLDYSISTFQNGCKLTEKRPEHLPTLKDDMLSLMKNTANCDVKLRTVNKTFQAHSIVLSARSHFFRNKLDKKNKEETICIKDLDNETLHQMLVFLYTDTIESLETKNVMNLYIASERYGIPSLKRRCSCFLQNNLDSSNCCEALLAADQYQDRDLKKSALNYILEHADEVIGSDKWQDLELYTELMEELMCLKRMNS